MNNEYFTGRNSEKERLSSFFDNQEGGSIFLAGRRGSGKTSLLKEVLSARSKHPRLFRNGPLRYTFNNNIQLYIPLIIVKKPVDERTVSEEYRSLILRSIAFALYTYSKGRENYKWPIPRSFFQNIGLVRQISKLKNYIEYSSFSKLHKNSLEIGQKGINVGLSNESNAVLDMSDAKLEMELREIMSTFSKTNDFTIVFDELDKLEKGKNEVFDIILYLKNLFSDTGVHAVFVGSEAQGYSILEYKNSSEDSSYSRG